ncbi:MAG: elongation factor P hydroxylase [Halioglobus sp.]|nr:elongation factor P hydroxylase [Halioglobus sp.]
MSCSRVNQGVFCALRLERVFNENFAMSWRTRLQGGADEPFYQPTTDTLVDHILYYRHDFFASALHEVAHWCIAGEERRLQPDFGYWYTPDDRDQRQQRAFEKVESKPQALEWIFSSACGYPFQPSADNIDLDARGVLDYEQFRQCVAQEVRAWQLRGLPQRAAVFYWALRREFRSVASLSEWQLEPGPLRGGAPQE